MQLPAHERSPRPGVARTAWLVGGLVAVLLLSAVLWEGRPWEDFSSSLVDTRWSTTTVRGVPMRTAQLPPFLQFLPHSTFYGTDVFVGEDTCNSLQGTYEVTGNKVRFTDISSSLVGCARAPDVMGTLAATRSWGKDWDKLHLYDASGVETMTLTRDDSVGYDPQPPAPTPT